MTKELDLEAALAKAIVLASVGHEHQRDLGGKPYILHPISVMNTVTPLPYKVAAILHDTLEDTTLKSSDLIEAGIPHEIVSWVEALTIIRGEDYIEEYIPRICRAGVAPMTVKLADLADNMRDDRPAPGHEKRLMRYIQAKHMISTALSNRSL